MRRVRRPKQATFEFRSWGGARRGAGRKPAGVLARVQHARRGEMAARIPVHVTLRIRSGLPSLRETRAHGAVRDALRDALRAVVQDARFHVVHYATQTNHLHLICEAEGQNALSRGVQGLCVRIARAINRAWRRKGRLFADRFHQRLLPTPREVRNAIAYVLGNAKKHGIPVPHGIDPYSSAKWFDGWESQKETRAAASEPSPVAKARTWLLAIGWKRWGLIPIPGGQSSVGFQNPLL